ncbi:MAG: helix-turn-helix transcriptional regulator [Clostridiales bacterium]|nr:helix-turn-helix transcriptional regulator [Clostridiales bacterium]
MTGTHRAERENVSKTRLMLEGSINLDNLDQFLKEARPAPKLSNYLMNLLAERDMSNEELGLEANIGRSTIYKIISGKQLPEQDMLLRMAFVLELSAEETQQLLKTGRRAQLTASRPRDIAIIYGLQNGLMLDEMDEILMERGLDPLIPAEKKISELLAPLAANLSFDQLLMQTHLADNASFMHMLGQAKSGRRLEALDEITDGIERNDLLCIGFVLGMNKVEMQRLLRIAHRAFLNSKDERDAQILEGLAAGMELKEIDAALRNRHMEALIAG